MLIVTCFPAQPSCIPFLPEHWNAIIKQQLCGLLPQDDAFLLTVVSACIQLCDTINSTQSLTRMYHHTAA